MAYDIAALPDVISLGRQGEVDSTEIEFDVADWLDLYPAGVVTIHAVRPTETDSDAYTVSGVATDGDTVTWTVSETDAALAGRGKAEILITEGDVVKKSALFATLVHPGIGAVTDAPDAVDDWLAYADMALYRIDGAYKGAYDAATTYAIGEVCVYSSVHYQCIKESLNHLPTDTEYFEAVAYYNTVTDATHVTITDSGTFYDTNTVEAALQDLGAYFSHNHTMSDVTDFDDHTHGNITNDGLLGTTTDLVVVTTTGGEITALAAGTNGDYLRHDASWANIFELIYPVGSIYISTASTDPGTLFPGTTWEAYAEGMFIAGYKSADADFGAVTSGEYTGTEDGGAVEHTIALGSSGYAKVSTAGKMKRKSNISYATDYEDAGISFGASVETATTGIELGGTAEAQDILPPYITCYVWRRVANA